MPIGDTIREHSKPAGDALQEYLKLYAKWAIEARAEKEEASQQFALCQAAREKLVTAVTHAANPTASKPPKELRKKAKTAKRHR